MVPAAARRARGTAQADLCPLATLQDLKLRYYELMIRLAMHEDAYLDACKAYQEVWDTDEVKNDEAKSQEVRQRGVWSRVSGLRRLTPL